MLLVSAGFDAADGDDLGECHVTPAGYAHMTHMLCSLAGGKVVVALEVRNTKVHDVVLLRWGLGGLLSRCYRKLRVGSDPGYPW